MPRRYLPIPDWFSFENQGGNIACADLSGTGKNDLIALMVNGAAAQNRGLYRIARDIDAAGMPRGGWTPWLDVPDWFSFENQGAGVAVADLSGNGKLDLVVFMIDAPEGQNAGLYRVGKSVDVNGVVNDGWGPWLRVPDWFSFENQHGAIALADLNGNGALDLVVLMVDNPVGKNQGKFRIGRDLDANGNVTAGWSPWLDVPDWFSFENQGAGITVADTDGVGRADLVVFHVDGAANQNQAFYKVLSGLDSFGNVTAGSGPWLGIPDWFCWENQGAGITALHSNNQLQLAVLMVDNPPGQNAGYYRLLPFDKDPAREGAWQLLAFNSQVLAVHAALLRTGKVVFFAGSGDSQARFAAPDFGDITEQLYTSVVWDPLATPPNNFTHPPTLKTAPPADGRPFDFFCGGDTMLPDGRLLSAGGTLAYDPFLGRRDATVFDPISETWSFVASMAQGRWYPSLISLGDGSVLAATGELDQADQNGAVPHNLSLEIYSSNGNSWRLLQFPANTAALPLYAHLFLLESGRVFFDGGHMDDELQLDPCTIDLTQNPVGLTVVPNLNARDLRNQSASVLLPPAQSQRVMLMGGGPDGKENKNNAVDNVDIVDFSVPNPSFVPGEPLALPRLHLNSVLLPDRTVLVTGGSLQQEDRPLARLQSEIYDQTKNQWNLTAPCAVPRLYHSTAVLLPDGRVVTAGSNPEDGVHVPWNQDANEEMRIEIFSPPYLFQGARPTFTLSVTEWKYGQVIDIQSANAGAVQFVSLMRNCVTTHSYDTNQRLVDAPIASRSNGVVKVALPTNENLAPTGWYMVFLVDKAGVPSVAQWVHLS